VKTYLAPPTRDFNGGEFALVISLAFGLWIAASLDAALAYRNEPIEFGDAGILALIGYEIVIGAVLAFVLRSRGWKWEDFSVHYSPGTTLIGVVLGITTLVAWYAFELVMGPAPNIPTATLPVIIAVSVLNPFFEELLVLAYVVQAMRKRFGLVTAMNVSIAIRLAYHLYQGPLAVIPIAMFGVVATIAYVRLGRLWPVIVAHAFLDFVPLSGFDPGS
jgi:membrane protease YdiL (CAAX protease family)